MNKNIAVVLRVGGVNGRTCSSRGFVNGIKACSRRSHTRNRGTEDAEGESLRSDVYYEDWIVLSASESSNFSQAGDSGSLVLAKKGYAVVGTVTGGSSDNRFTTIQDMGDVLDNIKEKLNVEEVVFAGCKRTEEEL